MGKSKYLSRLGQRPFIEILVEVITGLERRIVNHLPFSVKKYESIWSLSLNKILANNRLIESNSNYEYSDYSSGQKKQVSLSDRHLFSVTNVQADLYYGNIFSNEKVLIAESTIWSEFFLNAHFVPAAYGSKNIGLKTETLILASNSFYHFFLEDLPDFLRLYSEKPEINVVIWEHSPVYLKEVLLLLGIDSIATQRFVTLDRVTFLEKSKVIAPSRDAVDILRGRFNSDVCLASERKQIYVSRLGDSRSPSYERDLIRLLEDSGQWTVLNLSSLTFQEQLGYAQAAKVWMGVHGAGMSWLAIMNPKSVVIEIGPAKMDCFQQLAHLSQLAFHRVECGRGEPQPANYIFEKICAILENDS